ncbi:RING-H2 finger protein ATL70-like [Musa acuminata AAA Group]|uniref:RING-H2 finger protein ATL70-like n=1 Tax=Musa acuminata AAA Group TaxID=214697 RepID=UPI0031DDF53B
MMNSTSDASPPPVADGGSVGMLSSDRISGFGYGLGVSIGMLLLIITITLASYFCTRATTASPTAGPPPPPHRAAASRPAEQETTAAAGGDVEAGIDEDTLKRYPKVRYSHAKLRRDVAGAASCCSICLSDYKDADVLRALPECGHLFHVKCVDPWLRLRPTCPLCRTSPMPSPLPTPLADAVPLSTLARHP